MQAVLGAVSVLSGRAARTALCSGPGTAAKFLDAMTSLHESSQALFARGFASNMEPLPGPSYYADYGIYKGKGCMRVKLIPPTWQQSAKSAAALSVAKEGALLLEFASVKQGADQPAAYGARQYNWDNGKVVIALKVTEIGSILAGDQKVEIYHDPKKGGSGAGTISKRLSLLTNADGSKLITVTQSDKSGAKTSISVPVSTAEFEVLRTLGQFAIPKLLGFSDQIDHSPLKILPPAGTTEGEEASS
mmetsp:Transcript_16164/g.35006  ORF Transcript_16164/g.35006 Transcript_16164/m.35006 type:complete len:247 (-) Transcript_16164:850-1590(-)